MMLHRKQINGQNGQQWLVQPILPIFLFPVQHPILSPSSVCLSGRLRYRVLSSGTNGYSTSGFYCKHSAEEAPWSNLRVRQLCNSNGASRGVPCRARWKCMWSVCCLMCMRVTCPARPRPRKTGNGTSPSTRALLRGALPFDPSSPAGAPAGPVAVTLFNLLAMLTFNTTAKLHCIGILRQRHSGSPTVPCS